MPKIALVDDDRNILTSVSLTLEAEGYNVSTYTDGASGLEGLTSDRPDLAILDIKMPRMDGMELLRRLRQKNDMPVIFLTSKDEEIDELFGLKMGADDYIAKPFSQRLVVERVRAILRRGQPKDATAVTIPETLRQEVIDHAARVDRELVDGYEREMMISAAGYALSQAGLWPQSEALLTSNLKRAQSPYYLMSQLGGNARKLGKKDEALRWYGQAFETSVGPATRLQWGSGYLAALVDLAPGDAPRIEKTAAQLIREAAKDQGAFSGRSVRSMQRVSTKLVSWNADGKQAAVLRRLQAQLAPVCAKASAAAGQREACQKLLKPAAAAAAKA